LTQEVKGITATTHKSHNNFQQNKNSNLLQKVGNNVNGNNNNNDKEKIKEVKDSSRRRKIKNNNNTDRCPYACHSCATLGNYVNMYYKTPYIIFEKDPLIFDPLNEVYTDVGKMSF
jgi:hypothetical protein